MTGPNDRRLRRIRNYGVFALVLTNLVGLFTSGTTQLVLGLLSVVAFVAVVVAVAILSWLRLFRRPPKGNALSEPELHATYHNGLEVPHFRPPACPGCQRLRPLPERHEGHRPPL